MYLAIFGKNKEEGIFISDWEYWRFIKERWFPRDIEKFARERYRTSTGKEPPKKYWGVQDVHRGPKDLPDGTAVCATFLWGYRYYPDEGVWKKDQRLAKNSIWANTLDLFWEDNVLKMLNS